MKALRFVGKGISILLRILAVLLVFLLPLGVFLSLTPSIFIDNDIQSDSADGYHSSQLSPVDQPVILETQTPSTETLDETPLEFSFPLPGPEPVSLWRPPLNDAPWALSPQDHFYFSRPIAADEVNWPSADYRYGDFFPGTEIVHTGIDIAASFGTPVIAAGPGEVVWAGYGLLYGKNKENDPYGNAVAIRHTFGYEGRFVYTIYAHMDRVDVIVGQKVKTGDQIGIIGVTGNTTGPHLHFEVRLEANSYYETRNPELWLAPPQGWGVLVGRIVDQVSAPLHKVDVHVHNLDEDLDWIVRTYGPVNVNSDDYFNENLVLSDLPPGHYEISFTIEEKTYQQTIEIHPGAVTYFHFRVGRGFRTSLPALPDPEDSWLIPVE